MIADGQKSSIFGIRTYLMVRSGPKNGWYLVLLYSEQRRPRMCGHHIQNLFVLRSLQLSGPWRLCEHGSVQ